jgi:hypothetical protein
MSEVVRAVVSDLDLTRSVSVDRVDLAVVSVPVRISYALAIGRVGRVDVAPIVVSESKLTCSIDVDRVDLGVFLRVGRIGNLLAVG